MTTWETGTAVGRNRRFSPVLRNWRETSIRKYFQKLRRTFRCKKRPILKQYIKGNAWKKIWSARVPDYILQKQISDSANGLLHAVVLSQINKQLLYSSSNGIVVRHNRTISNYLSLFVSKNQRHWVRFFYYIVTKVLNTNALGITYLSY